MTQLNGIVRGNANNIATNESISGSTLYDLKDLTPIAITNAQMTNALTPAQDGFFPKDSIWFCTDNGTYTKDHFYQFTVTDPYTEQVAYSWVDKGGLGGGGSNITFEDYSEE